jgi:heme/copper-type cytochrome/quinol oxidase subunit 3
MEHTTAPAPLSRDEALTLKNQRTGVLVFQISWIMVFVCLILINLQIRANFATWPPPGIEALDRILPTVGLIALAASAFLARRGLHAIARDDRAAMLTAWKGALGLGVAFLVVMAFEWVQAGSTGQYSTIFRVMVGYHALHALVIGYLMVRVLRNAQAGGYDSVRYWGVEAAAKLWYFVVVAWAMFYVVLYVI